MLVSPDRLRWTYGGSLAADSRSWCQLLRKTFIHTREHTHTHTRPPSQTHIPSYLLSRVLSRPLLPAVRLSQNLLHTSIVGILEPPLFPIIPLSAKGQASSAKAGPLGVFANSRPQRGRMGRQIKASNAAGTKLCSKNSPAWLASLPSRLCLRVSSASASGCAYARHVCVFVPTAGLEILSKSHRLSSVWNREVLLGGQTDNETARCLCFYYSSDHSTCRTNHCFSHIGLIPTGLCLLFRTAVVSLLKVGVDIKAFSLKSNKL